MRSHAVSFDGWRARIHGARGHRTFPENVPVSQEPTQPARDPYAHWRAELDVFLSRWHEAGISTDLCWQQLMATRPIGTLVAGTVLTKAHFGAWIDIDVGFPALLELPYIRGLTPERYRADAWCPVGEAISARIVAYGGSQPRQVRLAQVRSVTSVVTPEERLRIQHLLAPLTTVDEVLHLLGTPDKEFPPGWFEGTPAEPISPRVLIYLNASETARIVVSDHGHSGLRFKITNKDLGEEEA